MTPPRQSEACKTRGSQIARERAQWATGARQDGIMVQRMCIGIPQPQPTMARIQDTTKVGPRIAFKYFPCPITIWYTSTHPHSSAEAICQWDRAQYTPSQCSASVAPKRHTGAGDSKKTKLIIVTCWKPSSPKFCELHAPRPHFRCECHIPHGYKHRSLVLHPLLWVNVSVYVS